MSVMGILAAAAVVGVTGIFVGLFLGAAGIKFKVEVDEKEEAVLAALPGNNCGVFRPGGSHRQRGGFGECLSCGRGGRGK